MKAKSPRWAEQIDQYGDMKPEQTQCLAMIKSDPERLKNTLHKGCNEQPVTTARERFLNYLQERMENEPGKKPLPECPNPNEKGIKLEAFLGKEGLKYYMAAIEEESKSTNFRDAVFQKSTSFYEGPTWSNRVIAPFGGPSAAGKSVSQKAFMMEIAKSIPTTNKDDGNFVVSVDGGMEREMSQIRGMVLQCALAKGFYGITDLDKNKASVKVKSLVEKASLATPKINIVIPKTYTNQMLSYPTGGIGKKDFAKYDKVDNGQAIVAMGIVEAQHENVVKNGNSRAWNTKPYKHSDIQMNKKPPCESKAYHDYYKEGTTFSNQAVDNYNKLDSKKKVRICVKVKSEFTFAVPEPKENCGWRLANPGEKWNKSMVGILARDFNAFKNSGGNDLKAWMDTHAWKQPPLIESTVRGAKVDKESMIRETAVIKSKQEWEYIKELAAQSGSAKFSKKDPQHAGKLTHSFLCIEHNGEKKLFRVNKEIGKGKEGVVRVVENEKGEKFAVKISPHKPGENPELSMMNQLNLALGDFVRQRDAKYSETFQKDVGDKQYVVQPLYPGEDLGKILANTKLSDIQKIMIAKKVSEAIQVLHDQGVAHRDIKAANVMTEIAANGEVKDVNVIDLGGAIRLEEGKKVGKPFGTPMFMSPEMGREEIRPMIQLLGSKKDELTNVEKKIEALEKDIVRYADIEKNPAKYNDHLRTLRLKKDELIKTRDMNVGEVGFENVVTQLNGKISTIEKQIDNLQNNIAKAKTIGEMRSSKAELEGKRDQLKTEVREYNRKLDQLYQKAVTITAAVDIYALGVMYETELGLNLQQLGLKSMLAVDPKDRPTVKEVQQKLEAWFKNKEQLLPAVQEVKAVQPSQGSAEQKVNSQSPQSPGDNIQNDEPPFVLKSDERLPPKVETKDLHRLEDGRISMLSKSQMDELKIKSIGKSNTTITIGNKEVYITQATNDVKPQAFVIAPNELAKGAFGSVYVAQNVETGEWSAIKIAKGVDLKAVPMIEALRKENVVLKDIDRLQGTISTGNISDLENLSDLDEPVMLASIQPFAFGKEYFDVKKEAKDSNTQIPAEKTAMMAFKAMEALYDLHEEKGYLYRDVKLENMLWDDKTKQCTIIDMGTAAKGKTVDDPTIQGTVEYMAPELQADKQYVKNRQYSQKTDVYSMGEVISRLLVNTKPEGEQYAKLTELANAMKNPDPQMRLSSQQALQKLIEIVKLDPKIEEGFTKGAENLIAKKAAPSVADGTLEALGAIGSKLAEEGVRISAATSDVDNKENIAPKQNKAMLTGFTIGMRNKGGYFDSVRSKPNEVKEPVLQQEAKAPTQSSERPSAVSSDQSRKPATTVLNKFSQERREGFLSAMRTKRGETESPPPNKTDKLGRR